MLLQPMQRTPSQISEYNTIAEVCIKKFNDGLIDKREYALQLLDCAVGFISGGETIPLGLCPTLDAGSMFLLHNNPEMAAECFLKAIGYPREGVFNGLTFNTIKEVA